VPENVYDIGDIATAVSSIAATSGDMIDPTSLFLAVRWPNASVNSFGYPDFTKVATGHYEYEIISLDLTGRYVYRWSSTGSGQAAGVNTFRVRDNAMGA
jgi:hypothetical protein